MKAKEMFEKLGYENSPANSSAWVEFIKGDLEISFFISRKMFRAGRWYDGDLYAYCFDLEEIQAITQQMKELGWSK